MFLCLFAWGIKFADANIGFDRDILTLPWFCAFLLPRMLKARRLSRPDE